MLSTYTLKNGIKVATYSIPQMRSVFLSTVVKAGSLFDNKKTSGTAHFMEHILFEGIPSYPDVESLSGFIESIAGSFNASTGTQSIRFHINAPAAYLDDLAKIASEVFFEPLFPIQSIEKERGAILEEIKMRSDNLNNKNYRFISDVRFKANHPMRLDGGGSDEAVKKLQREDLVNYWERFFVPKNTYVVVVGGIKNEGVKKTLEKYFDKYPSKKVFSGFPRYTNDDMSHKTTAIRFDEELQTCYLVINFPSISDKSPVREHYIQSLANNILGGLNTSRLYRLLRLQKGLVYSVGFGSSMYPEFGYVGCYSQVVLQNLEEVITLISKEMKAFIEKGPTEEELRFAKNYRVNRVLMEFDHPSSIASWIEGDLVWENKMYTPEEVAEIIESVTLDEINQFMKKNWDLSKLNLVIQGPIKNTKENIKKYSELVKDLK